MKSRKVGLPQVVGRGGEANDEPQKNEMNKKIREGILKHLCDYGDYVCKETCYGCLDFDEGANRCKKIDPLLTFLDENNVVQIEEKELPTEQGVNIGFKANPELSMPAQREITETAIMAYKQAEQDMLKAGWKYTERLI